MGDLYSLGGVQVSLEDLTSYLIDKKHEVWLYSHWPRQDDRPYTYDFDRKLKIVHYHLRDNVQTIEYVRNVLTEIDPDVVVLVNSGQLSLVILLAMQGLEFPVLLSERGGDEHNLQFNWFSREQRAIAHFMADDTHFLMESYRKGLPDWMSRQITCIPSLIRPAEGRFADPSAPDADGRYRVMYAGRLSFEKDVDLLIEAFARLLDRFPDWDLHIYGGGPDESSLRSRVSRLVGRGKRARRFVFAGEVEREKLYDAYCEAHLFVLASRNEGCPIALREAMARGLPVIGFATSSGVNQIVQDGSNGLLAGGGDKVDGLEAALIELMSDGPARTRLGKKGIKDVKVYAPDVVLSNWEKLILQTAACKGNRDSARAARYEGVAEVQRFARPIDVISRGRKVRNLFFFDPTIPLNRLEGIDPAEYALCFGSLLFDPVWYAREHFEVKLAGLNPLAHYLAEGHRLGYRPSEAFDPVHYRQQHPASSPNEALLVHYYRYGRYAGTLPEADPDRGLMARLESERSHDGRLANHIRTPSFAERVQEAAPGWYEWSRREVLALVAAAEAEETAIELPRPADRKVSAPSAVEGEIAAKVVPLQPAPVVSRTSPPKVSVIVPVYNKAEFVREALGSVLSQSYKDLEVVAIDDGSTDGSGAILDKMSSQVRNLVVIHQENRGLSGARNTGIAAARGDYVFCHDGDDFMEPEAIARLARVAHAHGSDVVGGVFRRKTQEREFVVTAFQENAYNLDFKSNTQKAFQYSTNISACNKMFNKIFLSRHNLKFTPGMQMEDIDLWLRVMFLSDKVSQTEHVVSTYVQREGSLSGLRTDKRFESLFDLVDGLIEYYDVQDWRKFAPMRNHALLQGAVYFFVKWKLEDFDGSNVNPDLRRLGALLQQFPADDLATFYIRKNKGPIASILLLARAGQFTAAKAVLERSQARGHAKLIQSNPNPTADDIVRHALGLINWTEISMSA